MAALYTGRQDPGTGRRPAALQEINGCDVRLRRVPPFAARSCPTVVTAQSQPLVLLVEDSEPLAEVYLAYIRRGPIIVRPAVLLLDIELPDGSGLDLIEAARVAGLDCAAIVITGHGSVNVAVE